LDPRYIFFPHWSYIIPSEIYSNFECVVFHMTDLPYGRGGSPLQNLIIRGFTETKISAFKVEEKFDSGPIYLKSELSLDGSASQIYYRASEVIMSMISTILEVTITPQPQTGDVTFFNRRTQSQSDIKPVDNERTLVDMIRMLDAEGYPKAYLSLKNFEVEFSEVSEINGQIRATAVFKRKLEGS
jgi:methionyl-tRNA formyltransferase